MLVDMVTKNYAINYRVITKDVLDKITRLFSKLKKEATDELPQDLIEILYVIRVANETYSGPSYDEFISQFDKNKKADFLQIIFQSLDPERKAPNRRISLTIDRKDNNNLEILGVKETWVKGSFDRFKGIIDNLPKRNQILYNAYFEMGVQLLAAFSLTTFSIYSAIQISSITSFEYSSVFIFVVLFVLFSNIWTYLGRGLIHLRNTYYPKVDIREPPRKPILLSIVSFLLLVFATWGVNYILDLIFKNKT
ncbi:MAG: hypothetical protein H8D56_00090 [Planctomycetes bacterium]|nr:hypothetical protein [Planctomycetota bacterium]